MSIAERIAAIEFLRRQAQASANVLFQRSQGGALAVRKAFYRDMIEAYTLCLAAIARELPELAADRGAADRLVAVTQPGPDSIDYTNQLIAMGGERGFAERLSEGIWDSIRECLPTDLRAAPENPRLRHALLHANRMFDVGIRAIEEYMSLLRETAPASQKSALSRLDPTGLGEFGRHAIQLTEEGAIDLDTVRAKLCDHDPFSAGRTFRPVHNELHPGPVGAIRPFEKFYGYTRERAFFADYFAGFAASQDMPPLVLSGMPGIGKTHLTISCALSMPGLVLILADRSYLEEPLEWLIDVLGQHHYRRFVLFFDDIEPARVNWVTFRNQVDGFLPYAKNVAIVIAANDQFPAPIRSRSRTFEFRAMDPTVCQEFIADYLAEHRWMSQPYPNLVSTLASDYVSMYKRRVLSELTPRSLVKYLEILESDKERIKRLIRESLEDVIRVPSEEAFVESNRMIVNQLRGSRGEAPLPPPGVPNPSAAFSGDAALPGGPFD